MSLPRTANCSGACDCSHEAHTGLLRRAEREGEDEAEKEECEVDLEEDEKEQEWKKMHLYLPQRH